MAKGYLGHKSGGSSGGFIVNVNGDPASTAEINLNDLTPQAPLDGLLNVVWQKDPDDIHISAYVPAREDLPFFGSSIVGRSNINTVGVLDIIPYGGISGSIEIIAPVGGWFRNLFVWTDTAMNAAHTKQLRLMKDAQLTALNMSVPPGSPAGVYGQTRSAVRINQGEQFRLDLATIGTASAGVVQGVSCEFATDDGSTMIGGCPNASVGLSASGYASFFSTVLTVTETLVEWKCPIAGTVRDLVLRTRNSQPSTGSLVCTIRKNSTGQAVTITIPSSGVVGIYGDFTNSFSVSPGDILSIEFTNNATSVSTIIYWWAFTILPDASARTAVLGGYANGIFTTAAMACGLFNNTSPPTTALDDHDVPLTRPGRLRNLYVRTTATAAVGLTLATYEIYVNGVASGIVATHGSAAAAGWYSDTTNFVDVVRGDRIRLQGITTGANGPHVAAWGLEFADVV